MNGFYEDGGKYIFGGEWFIFFYEMKCIVNFLLEKGLFYLRGKFDFM